MIRKLFALFTSLFAISITYAFSAQEPVVDNDFIVGARAAGMGGALTSMADDFSALHWNPAGLSRIKKFEVYGCLANDKLDTETTYFDTSSSTFSSKTRPNSFGIVIPVPTYQGGMAIAFGVNRITSFDLRTTVKGFNNTPVSEDPEFGMLYIDEITDESDSIYSWDLGLGVDVAPRVSVGATLCLLSGSYNYGLKLDASDTEKLDPDIKYFSYRDTINTDYFGIQCKLGLMAQVIDPIKVGLSIDVPLDFSADEYWTQDSYFTYEDDKEESEYNEGTVSYDISRPFRFSAGVSLHPMQGSTIAVNAQYIDWTQTKYSEPPSEDVSNEDFINDYRAVLKIGIGAELEIPNSGIKLRAGYMRDPLPYTPAGNEIMTERQFVTVGLGFAMEDILSVDLAYMRGFWKESMQFGNVVKDRTSNRFLISTSYRF